MRRGKQLLSAEDTKAVLEKNSAGTLALLGDEGYPYAVPMSYVYAGGRIYFHCAKEGHKLDAIRRYEKASFCVIDQDEVRPERVTTYFRSVIAFGRIRELTQAADMMPALEALSRKYAPQNLKECREEIDRDLHRLCMLEMTIDHMTGKEAIELVRARKGED